MIQFVEEIMIQEVYQSKWKILRFTSIQTKNHKEGIIPTSYSAMSIVSMI